MARQPRRLALARVSHGDAAAAVPGLANAFLLLFAASLADFATPLILAGNNFPVLPTQAYLQITGMFDLQGRRGAVAAAAGAGAARVPAAALLGRPPLLRHGDRQGAGQTPFDSVAPWARVRCWSLRAALSPLLIVYFYALLFYASLVRGVRRQSRA